MLNEEQLMRDLGNGDPLVEGPFGRLLTTTKREFERKKKKLLIAVLLYCLVGLAIMLYGGIILKHAEEVRTMIFGAVIVIIGFEITVLVKLGYGNIFILMRMLEAVKELHVALSEERGQENQDDTEEE